MGDDLRTIRTIPFDGKRSGYVMWASKFISLCQLKDCQHVLLNEHANMPSDKTTLTKPDYTGITDPDLILALNDKQILYNLQRSNKSAYAMLAMAVTDSVSFNAIEGAKTTKLTLGCARTAWVALESL